MDEYRLAPNPFVNDLTMLSPIPVVSLVLELFPV